MSLDEMIRFLKAINHRFSISYLDAADFAERMKNWEYYHRPED